MPSNPRAVFGFLRNILVRGALFIAPIWLSLFLIDLVCRMCDNYLGGITAQAVRWVIPASWLGAYADGHIPGLSLITALLLLSSLGFVASWKIGRAGLRLVDYVFLLIPGLNTVYSAARKVIDALGEPGKSRFQKVVLVDWPAQGGKAIGFVTNEAVSIDSNEKLYWVFVPHMPNPTSGFVLVFKASHVTETDMTIEQGLKFCLSLGVLPPPAISSK